MNCILRIKCIQTEPGMEKIEKVLEKGMKEILYYAGYEV